MKQTPHSTVIASVFIFSMLLFSCINEDNYDCPEDVRVYFSLVSPESNPADVDRMHLFVFNERGYFEREYRDNHIAKFGPEYYIHCVNMMPGNYRFIAWAGKDDNHYSTTPASFVKDKTTFAEALVILKHSGNLVTATPHHLFHSELAATVKLEKIQRFYMPLAQITNTVNIRTTGLPTDDNTYLYNIADNNCIYSFDRSFVPHSEHSANETFTYTTPFLKDEAQQLMGSLQILRLAANRRIPQLEIYNKTQGKVLYPVDDQSGDLIGLILRAYSQNDFENTHTYNIVLHFTGDDNTGYKVNITVNGWEVKEQDGELID